MTSAADLSPDEYTKTAKHNDRGKGISTSVLAILSLELRVASDFFHYVAENLRPAYEESKNKADALKKTTQDKAVEYQKTAQDKASEYQKYGQEKYEQLTSEASKKTDVAKEHAQKTKEKAQK